MKRIFLFLLLVFTTNSFASWTQSTFSNFQTYMTYANAGSYQLQIDSTFVSGYSWAMDTNISTFNNLTNTYQTASIIFWNRGTKYVFFMRRYSYDPMHECVNFITDSDEGLFYCDGDSKYQFQPNPDGGFYDTDGELMCYDSNHTAVNGECKIVEPADQTNPDDNTNPNNNDCATLSASCDSSCSLLGGVSSFSCLEENGVTVVTSPCQCVNSGSSGGDTSGGDSGSTGGDTGSTGGTGGTGTDSGTGGDSGSTGGTGTDSNTGGDTGSTGGSGGVSGTSGNNNTPSETGQTGDNNDMTPTDPATACNDSNLTLQEKMLCELNQGMKNLNGDSTNSNSLNNLMKDINADNNKNAEAINKNIKDLISNQMKDNTAINLNIKDIKALNTEQNTLLTDANNKQNTTNTLLGTTNNNLTDINKNLQDTEGKSFLQTLTEKFTGFTAPITDDEKNTYSSQVTQKVSNTLNETFSNYSNILGLSSTYAPPPPNITVTLFGMEFVLIDFSLFDPYVSVIRSLFLTLAYLYGFLFFLRGAK